jgi:FixJ family two-component response regulator
MGGLYASASSLMQNVSLLPPLLVAIVDDDERLCRSLGRMLRAAGILSAAYPSAEAFLGDLDHPAFHCLVLDVHLGGLSGIELQQQLAAAGGRTPVVFITSHDEPGTREQAFATGCAAFLNKSTSGSDVVAAIRRAAA